MSHPAIAELLRTRQPGFTLPRALYTDEEIYELDMRAIFHRKWLFVGFDAEIPNPGDYLSFDIGKTPVFVLRTSNGDIRGYFNTCRHRGSQILAEGSGSCRAIVCPYHQWTYGLEGGLRGARGMPREFAKEKFSLIPFAVESIGGTIYLCLSDDPPDITPFKQAFEPLISRYKLGDGRVVHCQKVIENANWKLAIENARECFHCQVGHPELLKSFINSISLNFDNPSEPHVAAFVATLRERGIPIGPAKGPWFSTAHVPLKPGYKSMTMNGDYAVRKPLATGLESLGVLRWHLQPHCYNLAMPDYVFTFSAIPISATQTLIESKWLVHKDARPHVDYDPETLQKLFSITNEQDISLTERNQRGVNSIAYRPGPYATAEEAWAEEFTDWYCQELSTYIDSASDLPRRC